MIELGASGHFQQKFQNLDVPPRFADADGRVRATFDIVWMSGWAPRTELPLDIQATAFQRRVWEELKSIPRGETRSYREIAQAIGQPTAARAVGQACASNPVALAIPCHRALRNDGSLGGYAWGIERKQALISAERNQSKKR